MIAEEDSTILRSYDRQAQEKVQSYVTSILGTQEDIGLILDTLDRCKYNGDLSKEYWVHVQADRDVGPRPHRRNKGFHLKCQLRRRLGADAEGIRRPGRRRLREPAIQSERGSSSAISQVWPSRCGHS